MMPLSYSIATGIACGFIFYPITMLISKKHKEVHPIMYVLMVLFILYFIFVHG
ncbi:Xanthine/uracil/thiamine/ascorbate permease family protein [Staphylococcus aureus]|nr:Xanthine/uracil/thiamine/ascorbate permease family protein [Staphylococcus aureus]